MTDDESLFDRARRRAQEAGEKYEAEAGQGASGGDVGAAALLAGGAAGGLAQTVADARHPAQYLFHTQRPADAALSAFVDALSALSDSDTQAQVTGGRGQATVMFRQQVAVVGWVDLLSVSLLHRGEEVTVAAGAPNFAALGGAAADLGGAAAQAAGRVLRGDLIGGAMAAAGNIGRASAAADALTFSSKVRAAIQRLGTALEAEWREREKERDAAQTAEQRRMFCQRCGARWPDDVVTLCPHCGAPREA
ncbi:MAG: zinc ribbon domain-containing protein [Anaerolineales bacterium]|nr:zinc ribbon domain-containing protein [Anaerolineales bacterium]